ncbi:hypothetical protein AXK12_01645 [Cephaloticoccus capnophilus]|uniref:Peptidase M14 domain-containing protein n=1 Tax=Cephaloticoccus capnophilus TaxID=1548208 RepID=A0A139SSH2_9BACT|nr:M14 family metallocarboxypeptidase [Cephaloticoccus capnophilus]KXU37513.1 hypothetical protein AXK12_01645 [Cephaloticoccus capnophilus]
MSTCTSRPSRLSRLLFQPATAPLPALTHIADFLAEFRTVAASLQNNGRSASLGGGASALGGKLETIGEVSGHPLFAWTRRVPAHSWYPAETGDPHLTPPLHQSGRRQGLKPTRPMPSSARRQDARQIKQPAIPKIYLSAGVHGDEPAGPLALLELLAEGFFDDRAHWFICPVLNPLGFVKGTRENADGIDLNRDYLACHSAEVRAHIAWLQSQPPFDLTFCLHEDWESTGFYLYEHNPKGRPSLAPALLDAARPHMPIEPAHIIDERPIDEPGILRPEIKAQDRDDWPEQLYLREHFHYDLGYTMETPSSLPLAPRIAAQKALVATAVEGLLKELNA